MARKTKKKLGAGKPKKTNFTRVKLSFHVLNKAIVRLVARFIRSNREEKPTRLLVSGQSPECSDCLLRFMEQQQ